jgi:hypothetical protein
MQNPIYFLPFFLFIGNLLHAQCIQIQNCPTTPVSICDLSDNDNQLWNAPFWWDNSAGSHDLAEAPVDLAISASNACNGVLSFRYQLFLDLDGDGVPETVVKSDVPPPAGAVWFGNANQPNFTGGTLRTFDQRPVLASLKYRFSLETSGAGAKQTARVRWRTEGPAPQYSTPELPYGTHKIKWIVSDGQGDLKICQQTLIVKDCAKPTVSCLSGLSAGIMPLQSINIWASDLLLAAADNYTPFGQLVLGIRRSGTGSGFPVDGNGDPVSHLSFSCNDIGTQLVELWVIDAVGNANFCETQIVIQDNALNCDSTHALFSLCVHTNGSNPANNGIYDLNYTVHTPASPGFPLVDSTFSDVNNDCLHAIPATIPVNDSTVIIPHKQDNPLNGVSQFDLVLIEKHINGTKPFTTPWQYIAADADVNGVIDSNDILFCRKLILGILVDFPNSDSWRLIRSDYVFPANPLQNPLPESVSLHELKQTYPTPVYFTAVKLCDVNGSAIHNNAITPTDRSDAVEYSAPPTDEVIVFPLRPNPSTGPVVLPFRINQSTLIALEIFDLNGKLIYSTNQSFDPGEGQLEIPAQALTSPGLYTWRLQASNQVFQGKLVRLQ